MDQLLNYFISVSPAIAIAGFILYLLPKEETAVRLTVILLGFILMRDSLLPAGLWQITPTLEMRFTGANLPIWLIAISSLGIGYTLRVILAAPTPRMFRGSILTGISCGIISSFIVFAPIFLIIHFGYVSSTLPKPRGPEDIAAVLAICLLGNFLEEVLFRGYLQPFLISLGIGEVRSIAISTLMFSLCHSYLAFTVTTIGVPILIFTAWEGVVCGILAFRFGIVASTLAHGLGIFWLATAFFV